MHNRYTDQFLMAMYPLRKWNFCQLPTYSMREETTNTPCIRYSPALCSLNTITGVNGEMKIKLWSITIQQERTP